MNILCVMCAATGLPFFRVGSARNVPGADAERVRRTEHVR